MASSPFGCNSNNLFGQMSKKLSAAAPAEPVLLIADPMQFITAVIPYSTKQAANIRKHMHENVLHEGQKIFIFRQGNGWTSIALESTAEVPKLTCEPTMALKIAWREFNNCLHVSTVTIKWKGSDQEIGFDGIDGMQPTFLALPESADEAEANKPDAEVIFDILTDLQEKSTTIDTKLAHLTTTVESLYKLIKSDRGEGSSNDPLNGRASKKGPTIVQVSEDEEEVVAQEPTTGKAQRKRKAKAM